MNNKVERFSPSFGGFGLLEQKVEGEWVQYNDYSTILDINVSLMDREMEALRNYNGLVHTHKNYEMESAFTIKGLHKDIDKNLDDRRIILDKKNDIIDEQKSWNKLLKSTLLVTVLIIVIESIYIMLNHI
jgi:hypothetical protein